MEPAGLAIGVLGIAGLFNNAVDCFEYVQIGRNFGQGFQTSVLKLDGSRLRLSRWGQSVGLSGNLNDTQSLTQALGSAQDVNKAEQVLWQILKLFAYAEGISTKFRTRPGRTKQDVLLHEMQTDLAPSALSLHNKMRDLSIKRQNHTSLRQKAKWALYEEQHFKRLIEDITSLVDDLVEPFPAALASQGNICKVEVASVGTQESLSMLQAVAENQDKLLEDAVTKVLNQMTPASNVSFSGNYN